MSSTGGSSDKMNRIIFHVDMDAFYASIEQRNNPDFRGKPVIVGADPKGGAGRGVVAACSYEARKLGVHSALPISQAYRLCPNGIYVRPHMDDYIAASREIRRIFRALTPLVEPLSIDEAFLDVTDQCHDDREAERLARTLKAEIWTAQKLTASVGIAPCKFAAKIASDLQKPNGLVTVRPQFLQKFLDPLPISRIPGVGPRTEEKLQSMNIATIGELRHFDPSLLDQRFGRHGEYLWKLANGIDDRPVVVSREVKSVSQERTFSEDTADPDQLQEVLSRLSDKVADRLKKRALGGHTVTLKLRYADFTTFTRQVRFRDLVCEGNEIYRVASTLLIQNWDLGRRIRLVGVGLSALEPIEHVRQMKLFGPPLP